MRSKSFRILIVAVCLVAVAAEIILIINVLGKKNPKAKAENVQMTDSTGKPSTATPEPEKRYTVTRMVSARSATGSVSYQYDEDGRVISIESSGVLDSELKGGVASRKTVQTYLYDEQGNVKGIEIATYDMDGNLLTTREVTPAFQVLETDGTGGVAVKADYFEHATRVTPGMESDMFLFDEEERLIRICYPNEGCVSEFQYDSFGNVILRIDYDSDGNEEKRRCTFAYIDGEKMISAECLDFGYDLTARIVYQYDMAGDVAHEEYYGADNRLSKEHDNIYDGAHHLTKRVRKVNGSDITIMEKEYEEFSVTEQYLTNEERMELGMPYDKQVVVYRGSIVDPYSWKLWSDRLNKY